MPGRPVAQFALPEFTITARIRPRLAVKDLRPTSIGAATTLLLVNNAAAVVPGEATTRARSGRPLALRPAHAAEKLNPAGRQILDTPPSADIFNERSLMTSATIQVPMDK
jgi:hypothetical protein